MQSPPERIGPHARAKQVTACIALALLFAVGGCVSTKTIDDMQRRIQELERENFRLQKELAEARVRRQMEREARSGTTTAGRSAAAPMTEEAMGASEEPVATSSVIHSEPIMDASAWTGEEAGAGKGRKKGSGGTPEKLMEAAQSSLEAHDPESAMAHFKEIVARHPDSALADDAQFGMGECYFQMGRYEDAIAEYRRVTDKFPFGDQVAYAFLKVGFSQLALDQRDAALESFRTVSEAYPGTEAATVARQQIGHLSRR